MTLTREDKTFLSKTTRRDREGTMTAKVGLSKKDREKLRIIDEANFMTSGEHLISNFEDLE